MTEVSDRYRTIADAFSTTVAGVEDGQWSARTPCVEWDVRELLEHVVGVHRMAIGGLTGDSPGDPAAGEDLAAAWRSCAGEVSDALADAGLATKPITGGPFEGQPFEQVVGTLVCADTLIHTWDLARATGQDERLDPDAVNKAMQTLSAYDAGMRRPGGFAEKIEPAAGADDQTRLLNFCGRTS